ncbi:DUF4199 domain-containing protein [Hymenobacter psoromatis]|uniref:DUF4199 domain-containing protein n=1 Tax=Hymenobacter psoromatis TaxID=1484116 RepID=UPI001CBF6873|nr:DUF4199 domain-containing protein [Hymenobacter psoromatis]
METTGDSQVTPTSVGLRYGLLTGLICIIISFGLNAMHMEASPLRYLTYAVIIGGIVLAQREFKLCSAGFMGYGQGLGIGTLLSGVVGLLSAVFAYVYINFVDPDIITRGLEKARADMEARGTMSDAQIEQGLAWGAKFSNGPFLFVLIIILTLLFGLVVSLITAAILKNAKPEFE